MTTTTQSQEVSAPARPAEPAERLSARLGALGRLVELGAGRIEPELLAETRALLDRAGDRLRLSGDHTVVALVGGTGSGKSSLFNAVCGLDLSPVGVTRPLTSAAHACVWGLEGAGPLLDWLQIQKRYRYARASALDEQEEGSLRGLVLLDLPDHDSVQAKESGEVDRLVGVADMLVFVLDPQKYADAAVHWRYLGPLADHSAVTVVVLNQIDRLCPEEVEECLTDLRRILESEGVTPHPTILTTSTVTGAGLDELRKLLIDTVADRRAAVRRLAADVDHLIDRYKPFAGAQARTGVDPGRTAALVEALTDAAGAAAVCDAFGSAYVGQAARYVGWPVARLGARFRGDPLRRMRLKALQEGLPGPVDGPVGAQQPVVDAAVQEVAAAAAEGLPDPWAQAVRQAGRSRADELPDALGGAVAEALPDLDRLPAWWRLIQIWQWLLLGVAVVGLVWLGGLLVSGVLHLVRAPGFLPGFLLGKAAVLPYAGLLTVVALTLGLVTAAGCRNLVGLAADRQRERAETRMRTRIEAVAREYVIDPIEQEQARYAAFSAELAAVRGG